MEYELNTLDDKLVTGWNELHPLITKTCDMDLYKEMKKGDYSQTLVGFCNTYAHGDSRTGNVYGGLNIRRHLYKTGNMEAMVKLDNAQEHMIALLSFQLATGIEVTLDELRNKFKYDIFAVA